MDKLREFTCMHCGHRVVVHPDYPKDSFPTTCMQCFEQVVKPKIDRSMREIELIIRKFLGLLGDPVGPPLTAEEERTLERRVRQLQEREKSNDG